MTSISSLLLTIVSGMLLFVLQGFLREWKAMIAEKKAEEKEKEQQDESREKALENGVLCLLRAELIKDHEKHMALGTISPAAYENGMAMYAAYKALGGNGLVEHMKDEIEELNLKTKKG